MKHKPEEIIRFVERRIRDDKKLRWLTPLLGVAIIGCSFALFKMVVGNEHIATIPFLKGFVFAVFFLPISSIGIALVFCLFRTGSFENDTYQLLLELWKEKHAQAEPGAPSNPHSPSAQGPMVADVRSEDMKESYLQAYLRGQMTARALRQCLRTAVEYGKGTMTSRWTRDIPLDTETITIDDLIALSEAFVAGDLAATDLQEIAFILIGSDGFGWDNGTEEGEIVAETLHDWASPEINGALTQDSIGKKAEELRATKSKLPRVPLGT